MLNSHAKADRQLLSSILNGGDAAIINGVVSPDDLYSPDCRVVFRACLAIADRGEPIDPISVSRELEVAGERIDSGTLGFISDLLNEAFVSGANIEAYAKAVKENANRRRLIQCLGMAYKQAQEISFEIGKIASSVEKELGEISFQQSKEVVLLDYYRKEFSDRLEAIGNGTGGLLGLTTGFPDLDAVTGGLCPGDFWVIASRPGMGKTALSVATLEANAKNKTPVLLASLEMPGAQIYSRLACSKASVNMLALRSGKLADSDFTKFMLAEEAIQCLPFYLADVAISGYDDGSIRGLVRKAVRKMGIKLFVVDYLQLMSIKGHRGNRENEVSQISRGLKQLARHLGIAVVGLAQLGRECEKRPDKRPELSDLRESGAIEQDADNVLMVYRDEYYHKDTDEKGVAEVIIKKQRNGPPCTVKLQFTAAFARFGSLDQNRPEPEQRELSRRDWE